MLCIQQHLTNKSAYLLLRLDMTNLKKCGTQLDYLNLRDSIQAEIIWVTNFQIAPRKNCWQSLEPCVRLPSCLPVYSWSSLFSLRISLLQEGNCQVSAYSHRWPECSSACCHHLTRSRASRVSCVPDKKTLPNAK